MNPEKFKTAVRLSVECVEQVENKLLRDCFIGMLFLEKVDNAMDHAYGLLNVCNLQKYTLDQFIEAWENDTEARRIFMKALNISHAVIGAMRIDSEQAVYHLGLAFAYAAGAIQNQGSMHRRDMFVEKAERHFALAEELYREKVS